jgi:assimilatory nitrate reductase catalytic subunit
VAASRVVCNCLNVSERAIHDALDALPAASNDALRALQARTACGTSCGSCVPEVRRMIAARHAEAATA